MIGSKAVADPVIRPQTEHEIVALVKFTAGALCEFCNTECPLELPIERNWMEMRGELIHNRDRLTFSPFQIKRVSLKKERNMWGSYRSDRRDWAKGCATNCLRRLSGYTYLGEDKACCGISMLMGGLRDMWEEMVRHSITAVENEISKMLSSIVPPVSDRLIDYL